MSSPARQLDSAAAVPVPPARRRPRAAVPLAVAGALVLGCHLAGIPIAGALHLGQTYPIAGSWRSSVTGWFAVPVAAALLACWGWPVLARRLRWRPLLAVSTVVAAGWSVALALVDGPAGLTAPLAPYQQYPHDVPRVTDLGDYLATFARHVVDPANGPVWTVHVGGHPPGALGVFVLLDRLGLGGLGWAAALCIAGGALAVPSVLTLTRLYGGAGAARRAALFVPLAPAALWIATSADALFAGVAAAGLCALAVAARGPLAGLPRAASVRAARVPGAAGRAEGATRRARLRTDLLAAVGGLALGSCLFLSYGLSLLAIPAVAVALLPPGRSPRSTPGEPDRSPRSTPGEPGLPGGTVGEPGRSLRSTAGEPGLPGGTVGEPGRSLRSTAGEPGLPRGTAGSAGPSLAAARPAGTAGALRRFVPEAVAGRPAGTAGAIRRFVPEVVSPQRIRPLIVGAAVVLGLLLAARWAGYDWWHGLSLAAERTRTGVRAPHPPTVWQDRPTWYFLVANPAALAVLLGPAAIAALGYLRRTRLAVVPAAAALAVLGALVSDLSKGEVERIYLPFALLMLPLTALLPIRRYGRLLLAVQLGWAVLIAVTIETWW